MDKLMNKVNVLGAVVQGGTLDYKRRPDLFVGDEKQGYIKGDLMDANAVSQLVSDAIQESAQTNMQADWNQDDPDKNDYIKNKPKTLSTFKNQITEIELGYYLYSDLTWSKEYISEKQLIGCCVGTPDMFPDGKARFCEVGGDVDDGSYKWSTKNIAVEGLPIIDNIDEDYDLITYEGWKDTDVLLNDVNTHPAAEHAKSKFNGNGYLPTIKEMQKCREYIARYCGFFVDDRYIWTSNQQSDKAYSYDVLGEEGARVWPKDSRMSCVAFYAVDPPRCITTEDIDPLKLNIRNGDVVLKYEDVTDLGIGLDVKSDDSFRCFIGPYFLSMYNDGNQAVYLSGEECLFDICNHPHTTTISPTHLSIQDLEEDTQIYANVYDTTAVFKLSDPKYTGGEITQTIDPNNDRIEITVEDTNVNGTRTRCTSNGIFFTDINDDTKSAAILFSPNDGSIQIAVGNIFERSTYTFGPDGKITIRKQGGTTTQIP